MRWGERTYLEFSLQEVVVDVEGPPLAVEIMLGCGKRNDKSENEWATKERGRERLTVILRPNFMRAVGLGAKKEEWKTTAGGESGQRRSLFKSLEPIRPLLAFYALPTAMAMAMAKQGKLFSFVRTKRIQDSASSFLPLENTLTSALDCERASLPPN